MSVLVVLGVVGLLVLVQHGAPSGAPPALPPVAGAPPPAPGGSTVFPSIAARVLAVGSAPAGSGLPTGLSASASSTAITVQSASPIPVAVSLSDGYRARLRPWTALAVGHSAGQTLVTGRSYGYCFTQVAVDGYARSRGCGTLVMHSFINGVEAPDGATVPVTVTFASR